MLTEQTVVSAITILEDGQLQVRRSRRIFDGAAVVAEQYCRHVLAPGDDVSKEDERVRQVSSALWTPEVVAEFRRKQVEAKEEL